jgi:hypothetical protein
MAAWANPELIRNLRAQLRPDRMLTVAAICAVLSLVVGFAESSRFPGAPASKWGLEFLGLVIWAQVAVLVFGGGFAVLQAVPREKELNTFDFQRVTRLTPLELTVGKLLGAPALIYFVALCLMPAAAVGAITGRMHLGFVLAGYAIVLLGAVTVHALALLLSLLVDRGVATAVVLVFFALWIAPALSVGVFFALHLGSLSPFVARQVISLTSWAIDPRAAQNIGDFFHAPLTDVLFGRPVHHVPVLVVLYLVFTGWFLVAVARNIKRDPAAYEIFTPGQALGFALYVNLILVAFFRWSSFEPFQAHETFLGINAFLFFALGLVLLRNRDETRRLRVGGTGAAGWVAALWPATYVAAGSLLAGLAPVAILEMVRKPDAEWNLALAVFRTAMVSAWITRDILFLQWMNLQPGGRPLRRGILYLAVFYTCGSIVIGTLRSAIYGDPHGLAAATTVIPAMVFAVRPEFWIGGWAVWLAALGGQVAAAGSFASLQRQKLAELTGRRGPSV